MTAKPTLVEKMARATSRECFDGCEHAGEIAPCVDPPCPCRRAARAALAVVLEKMREPSEGMLEHACGEKAHHALLAKAIWFSMLDQFEKEQAGG